MVTGVLDRSYKRDKQGRFSSTGAHQDAQALDQVPAIKRTAAERDAINDYRGASWFRPMNEAARDQWDKTEERIAEDANFLPHGVHSVGELRKAVDERNATVNGLMERSRLQGDVELWRGIQNARPMFGDRLDGDLTGMQWHEAAPMSTSARSTSAKEFSGMSSNGVHMRVTAHAGVGAVKVSDWDGEAEVLIQGGRNLRVVADHGVDPAWGHRVLDVEVVD